MTVAYALGSFKFVPPQVTAMEGFEPTQARPGSKEKMRIIRKRIQKGMPLHHPQDKKNNEEFSIPPEDEKEPEDEEAA
jgi:hypothetical protein